MIVSIVLVPTVASCDSWVLLQSAAACRPDTAAQPPAAALQDRKTRAAENQHQPGVRLVTAVTTHTLQLQAVTAAPALQIWVAVWAPAGRGAPAAAESGPGIPQGEDTAASSHQPPTIFTVSTPPTECLGWPRHV